MTRKFTNADDARTTIDSMFVTLRKHPDFLSHYGRRRTFTNADDARTTIDCMFVTLRKHPDFHDRRRADGQKE